MYDSCGVLDLLNFVPFVRVLIDVALQFTPTQFKNSKKSSNRGYLQWNCTLKINVKFLIDIQIDILVNFIQIYV